MEIKNDNKSLFLYTGLIFLVAIIIIIIAFFGQANVMKSQPNVETKVEATATPQDGILQKTSVLSEQNAALIKQTEELKAQLNNKDADLATAQARISELEVNLDTAQKLCSVYEFTANGRMDDAREVFAQINPDALTEAQKIAYTSLKQELD